MKMRHIALAVVICIALAGAAYGQARDGYLCYAAKKSKKICGPSSTNAGALCEDDTGCTPMAVGSCINVGSPPKGVSARLDDASSSISVGEDKTFGVGKPKHLCIPVDKDGSPTMNGENVNEPGVGYVTYGIKQAKSVCVGGGNAGEPCKEAADCPMGTCTEIAKFDKAAPKNTSILAGDKIADVRFDASKVAFMMAPASVCAGDDSTCPDPEPAGKDHFKCYAIKATKGYCSNPASPNWLESCPDDAFCGTGSCTALPKFPKGLASVLDDAGTIIPAAGRAFGTTKPAFFCKAVEKTLPPSGTPEPPANPANRMLCYKAKATGQCAMGSPMNAFGPCAGEADCGGTKGVTTHCVAPVKFNKDDPGVQGFYAEDQFDGDGASPLIDHHRLNLSKEDLVCAPACEFSPLTFRATSLAIPPTGHPGDGLDIDENSSTCRPHPVGTNCSGGIDNSLGSLVSALAGFGLNLNTVLQDEIDSGSINILLNLDELANGSRLVTGHTGELAPNNPACDIDDPGSKCDYVASCAGDVEIVFPVTLSGMPGSPATITGGGPGTSFGLALPFGNVDFNLVVRNVKVQASVVHSGGSISSASGIIGGAIIQRELKNAIGSIPDGVCAGGSESGELCPPASCTGGGLCLSFSFIASLMDGIPRDIDTDGLKTCEGGTNNGESCSVIGDCPDGSNPPVTDCTFLDGMSVGLVFSGIDANIVGVDR